MSDSSVRSQRARERRHQGWRQTRRVEGAAMLTRPASGPSPSHSFPRDGDGQPVGHAGYGRGGTVDQPVCTSSGQSASATRMRPGSATMFTPLVFEAQRVRVLHGIEVSGLDRDAVMSDSGDGMAARVGGTRGVRDGGTAHGHSHDDGRRQQLPLCSRGVSWKRTTWALVPAAGVYRASAMPSVTNDATVGRRSTRGRTPHRRPPRPRHGSRSAVEPQHEAGGGQRVALRAVPRRRRFAEARSDAAG